MPGWFYIALGAIALAGVVALIYDMARTFRDELPAGQPSGLPFGEEPGRLVSRPCSLPHLSESQVCVDGASVRSFARLPKCACRCHERAKALL